MHAHAPAAPKQGNGAWQLDALLSYAEDSEAKVRGVLPQQNHYDQAGLRLKHVDISRSFVLRQPAAMQGLVSLGYHGDGVELEQAWLQPYSDGWQIKIGQMQPEIGWLNQQHSHALAITDRPLVYKALWAGQTTEAGVSGWHDWYKPSGNWRFSSSVLTTEKRNTRGNSGAWLSSLSWQRHWDNWVVSSKLDGYWASLQQSGLQLFSDAAISHSHGDDATEFFSGHSAHLGVALKVSWTTLSGTWSLMAEHQQRRERGDLSSAAGQTLDAQAELELKAAGQYVQTSWLSPRQQWQLAVRYDAAHSDVELSRVNGQDLQQSLLNHHQQQPQLLTLAASARLWPGSHLRWQWYEALQHGDDIPQWQLLLQQSVAF
ncbi:hypothetical protein CHH28_02735 [Bacterioplanes sanyensis]|uniref:Uncharacterized protein n=1 Tax=Bacterioplanes sanyensis TaxID=1249553 RepID=A0A222FG93_9GAMM|nr:hypothetical protein CHH28_02735 [Bacterioplanes sanyensis]